MERNICVIYQIQSSVHFHFLSCYHIYVAYSTNILIAQLILHNEVLAVDHKILVVTILSAKNLAHMVQNQGNHVR